MKNLLFFLLAILVNTNIGAQVLLKNYPGELFLYCYSKDTFILIDSVPHVNFGTEDSYLGFQDLRGKILRKEITSGVIAFDTIGFAYSACTDKNEKGLTRLNKSIPLEKSDEIDFVFQDDTIHLEILLNGNLFAKKKGSSNIIWRNNFDRNVAFAFPNNKGIQNGYVVDYSDSKILYLCYSDDMFSKPKRTLYEIDIKTGKVTFKSKRRNCNKASYLNNTDFVFSILTDNGLHGKVFFYNAKKNKIYTRSEYGSFVQFFSLRNE